MFSRPEPYRSLIVGGKSKASLPGQYFPVEVLRLVQLRAGKQGGEPLLGVCTLSTCLLNTCQEEGGQDLKFLVCETQTNGVRLVGSLLCDLQCIPFVRDPGQTKQSFA